ncbi:uncharacterized protein N7459_001665 [Penicillium hispanicum]|uniref:uncharacterized protein n=1 Tax=Penicillium hispanicum TaxID=1080232 RepID=UPI00254175FB|nr:uncharacterized protein N7459_001665 [Penicillium hispanicum]KAJ5595457.1 hypothetical protein N7459_001665 [Penicillium hispanicum]
MFYSHEILTSPEHGVATIWLVATLGSRSITRRLNRKAILDVDVPEACRVIINPEAPMALRLQGSLLYGVSRVYHQQCGYTLLDAQAMHDKMISMLKLMPGGGLDPSAGKAKPSSLVLPYDPTFLPETGLPGLDIDFNLFNGRTDDKSSQRFDLWTKSPAGSQSSTSHMESIQLELPSDDAFRDELLGVENEGLNSGKKRGLFGKSSRLDGDDEEGILLQPDFEFDENGNIVEFDASMLSPRKRRRASENLRGSQAPTERASGEDQELALNEDTTLMRDDEMMDIDAYGKVQSVFFDEERPNREEQEEQHTQEVVQEHRIRRRAPRSIVADDITTLRTVELTQWNEEYLANMALASKQKRQNRIPTVAKKNAAFWVFGQGIGSVGNGVGRQREAHPLKSYSAEGLYNALCGAHDSAPKRAGGFNEGNDTTAHLRQERAQGGSREPMDVEIGRQAPSSIYDDRSSQMPWNITASVQSSRHGRVGSVSELSARGVPESGSLFGCRSRGRLASASPLAGRGYLDGRERLSSLSIPGNTDGELEDLDITQYLEGELAADLDDIHALSSRRTSMVDRAAPTLDRESLNFFDFITARIDASETSGAIAFSALLPPVETSRTVATQGLMNVLTLATKGLLRVSQEPYVDAGIEAWGVRYQYGEIHLQLCGL